MFKKKVLLKRKVKLMDVLKIQCIILGYLRTLTSLHTMCLQCVYTVFTKRIFVLR